MRKRRRLADKLTISVCAVLVAVSAFFYAPMDALASEPINGSFVQTLSVDEVITTDVVNEINGSYDEPLDISTSGFYYRLNSESEPFAMMSGLDSDSVYKVDFTFNYTLTPSVLNTGSYLRSFMVVWNTGYNFVMANALSLNEVRTSSLDRTFYLSGSDLMAENFIRFRGIVTDSNVTNMNLGFDYNILINSITELSNTSSDEYQNGYNAGYSAGEQAGYGNGYSQGFADGESSVDTNDIYNQGFQAGKDSVDTESYYDAGYQAGYQIGVQESYQLGYDDGYQSAMDRVDGWGADTSQYPLLLSESSDPFNLQFDFIEEGSDEFVYSDYSDVERYYPDVDFNPNHTYKLEFSYHDFTYDYDTFFTSSFSFWLYWGDSSFPLIVGSVNDITTTVFIPGDRVGNGLRFRCDLGQIESNGSIDTLHYYLNGCYLKLYDMGPSGDTQNHIANQTDKLTGGWDGSSGSSANSNLTSGLNEFETAENSLFATATTGMKDFTFFDIESVPAMLTAVTFITSIMGSWFEYAGGASGVGIVLSILFSVMLVSMVLGLYRLYQSAGHRAEARQRHAENMERWKKGK